MLQLAAENLQYIRSVKNISEAFAATNHNDMIKSITCTNTNVNHLNISLVCLTVTKHIKYNNKKHICQTITYAINNEIIFRSLLRPFLSYLYNTFASSFLVYHRKRKRITESLYILNTQIHLQFATASLLHNCYKQFYTVTDNDFEPVHFDIASVRIGGFLQSPSPGSIPC